MNKYYVKIAHALLQVVVLLLVIVGLTSVFMAHRISNYENVYSIHSWLGLTTIGLFLLQWIFGFVMFLFPKFREDIRGFYLPHHRFFGLAIFVYSCATSLMGLAETSIYDVKKYVKF